MLERNWATNFIDSENERFNLTGKGFPLTTNIDNIEIMANCIDLKQYIIMLNNQDGRGVILKVNIIPAFTY